MYSEIIFPEQILDFIVAGGIIMISAIIIIGFILIMRYSAKMMPAFLSLLIYLVVVYVGVRVLVTIASLIPGLNKIMAESLMAYCVVNAVLTALMMHLTRFVVLKFADANGDLELGTAMMAGLGAAISQAILSGIDMISWWVIGNNINAMGVNELLKGMPAEDAQRYIETIEGILALPENFFLLKGIGNTIDIVFQVAVCVILYGVIKKGVPAFWHMIIIGVNIVLSATTIMGDYGVTSDYMTLTIIKTVVLVAVIIVALRLDSEILNGELRSFSKLKTAKSMPKFNNLKNK